MPSYFRPKNPISYQNAELQNKPDFSSWKVERGGGRGRGGEEREEGDPLVRIHMQKRTSCSAQTVFPRALFFPKITGTNVPKIVKKQPDGLPDKKENYPSAMRKSISQRPDDNNVPSVAIVQILLAKGDQVFTRAAVSRGQDTHTQTHTRTHTHMHQRPLQYPLGFILASLYGT